MKTTPEQREALRELMVDATDGYFFRLGFATVRGLLDDLEAAEKRIVELEQARVERDAWKRLALLRGWLRIIVENQLPGLKDKIAEARSAIETLGDEFAWRRVPRRA